MSDTPDPDPDPVVGGIPSAPAAGPPPAAPIPDGPTAGTMLRLLQASTGARKAAFANWLGGIVVGTFGFMCVGLVLEALGVHGPLPHISPDTYLSDTAKDYALLVEAPIGAVLGYYFATHRHTD